MSAQPQSPPLNPLAFIDRVIADIELSPNQFEQATQSYEAVTSVLQRTGSPIRVYSPKNRPQGSMRIGTTIRPLAQEEHDLDVLCWLDISGRLKTPHAVYELVWDTLGAHETYKNMRERKSRCIRLSYARRFHLDITPAIPDFVAGTDALYIPDREKKVWCSTHPIGFADDWFKPISLMQPRILQARKPLIANERSFSASVEPLPEYGAFEKTPLQRTVQLLKFDRDKHYSEDPQHRPSSILLTTLTGRAYERELALPAETMLEFIIRVVQRIREGITLIFPNGEMKCIVPNPVNLIENFAEGWTAVHYHRFCEWHEKLLRWLRSTATAPGHGADVLFNRMSEEFGKDRVVRAANSLGEDVRRFHETGRARVNASGYVGATGAATLGRTVFFGA